MVSSVTLGQASEPETALASAATTDLGSAVDWKISITGTVTITSFGTRAHCFKALRFAGALTLTHNATSLILPSGANITTAAGDTCLATSDGSGNWRIRAYQRASGKALVGPASTDISDATTIGKAALTAASFAAHGFLLGEGAGAIVATAAPTDGQIPIGQTGADPSPTTISGDATLSAAGVLTVATIGGKTPVSILGQSHIPMVLCSSGTMGNNGALSGITALPRAYAKAYVYLPSGAIAAGSAAGWYYAVFSSTTAATIYNNTYSSGTPAIPGSPTAFSTTGPGAFTQSLSTYIVGYSLTVAGNVIGANGGIRMTQSYSFSASTNNKVVRNAFGGTFGFLNTSNVTAAFVGGGFVAGFANSQATNVQTPLASYGGSIGLNVQINAVGAVDTTTSQAVAVWMNIAVGTDFIVNESVVVELLPGVA